MKLSPYTIKLFMPDGNSNNIKIINKMNWTGVGLEIAREALQQHKTRVELKEAGIYILIGYEENNDLPIIYIGQGDGVGSRLESHDKKKDFWDKALIFVSNNGGLNRGHITWLEWALIKLASDMKRCKIDNTVTPTEPILTESEKADTKEFLNEILSILPLLEVRVFEKAQKILINNKNDNQNLHKKDTIIVPAQEDGFKEVFLGENSWYALRIAAGRLTDIKYIAAYQTAPISAVTHYAEIQSIEPYGDGKKYKLNFKDKAKEIEHIKLNNSRSAPQSSVYTSFEKLQNAKNISDLF